MLSRTHTSVLCRVALVIAASSAVVGCAKSDDDGDGGGIFRELDWEGSWQSDCVAEDGDFGQAGLHFAGFDACDVVLVARKRHLWCLAFVVFIFFRFGLAFGFFFPASR